MAFAEKGKERRVSARWGRLMRTAVVAGLLATSAAPGAARLAWGGEGGPKGPAAVTKMVAMKDSYFSPKTTTITKGSKVKWVNKGNIVHTTTGGGWTKTLSPGQSWTKTFKKKGTFKYACTFHAAMTGKIKVV